VPKLWVGYPWRKIGLHRLYDEMDACSAYIVKRRYVWKLPGVLSGRKIVSRRPSPVPKKPWMV